LRRKLLNVNYNRTTHIEGLPAGENQAILSFPFEHLRDPELPFRLKWNPGDIVNWDNRATQHQAVADFRDRRLTLRKSILMPQT
jgi:taurine dioxygenase